MFEVIRLWGLTKKLASQVKLEDKKKEEEQQVQSFVSENIPLLKAKGEEIISHLGEEEQRELKMTIEALEGFLSDENKEGILQVLSLSYSLLFQLIAAWEKRKNSFAGINFIKENICPFCVMKDIVVDFLSSTRSEMLKKVTAFLSESKTLKENIDKMNDFIVERLGELAESRENVKKSWEKDKDLTEKLYSSTNTILDKFKSSMDFYYNELNEVVQLIQEVEEVFSKMKVFSFNLGIEATKSQNKALKVIAAEFQKMVKVIEQMNVNISNRVSKSISFASINKNEVMQQIEEFANFINLSIEIKRENEEVQHNLQNAFYDIMNEINEIQEENKKDVFDFFKIAQEININLEIVGHLYDILDVFVSVKADKTHDSIGGKLGLCMHQDEKMEVYRSILGMIETKATTQMEKDMIQELYKKYQVKPLSDSSTKSEEVFHFSEEGVILF
uniref:Methyl-accepting transducer domain-containing protein n=1 Tax=Caldisericum exile TaxID=693075 RepID=A0A7C4XTT3_9BACT